MGGKWETTSEGPRESEAEKERENGSAMNVPQGNHPPFSGERHNRHICASTLDGPTATARILNVI